MYEGVCRQHVRRNESVIMYMYGTGRTLHAVTSYVARNLLLVQLRRAALICAASKAANLQRIATRGRRAGN